MKVIRFLAVLAIIVFFVDVLGSGVVGFIRGMNHAVESAEAKEQHFGTPVTLNLRAVDEGHHSDSLYHQVQQRNISYDITSIEVCDGTRPTAFIVLIFLFIPVIFAFIYGLYCVVRMIYSVSRGEVFTHRNVRRMRIFVYSCLATGFILEAQAWVLYHNMASQVSIPGYDILPYATEVPWFEFLIQALFCEIFAVGVNMKDEQDLTI